MNNVIPIGGRATEAPEAAPIKPVPPDDDLLQLQYLAQQVEQNESDPEAFWESVAALCNFLAGWQ